MPRLKGRPEEVLHIGQEGIPVPCAGHHMIKSVPLVLHQIVDQLSGPPGRITVEIVGKDLVHILDQETDAAVGIRIFRILFAEISPDRHVVVRPVGIVKEDLQGKIEEVIVHIHRRFKRPLVLLLSQVRCEQFDDLCPGIDIHIAPAVFFDSVRDIQAEQPADIVLRCARGQVTDCIEVPVQEHDTQAVLRQSREARFVRKLLCILIADAADMKLRDPVGPEFDLLKGINGSILVKNIQVEIVVRRPLFF